MISTDSGRKIFFVYPHSVVRNELIHKLIDREYEIYLINDHSCIELICEKYIDPIIFINIDEGLSERQWEDLILNIKSNQSTQHAQFGIFTYNENEYLSKKYLMDIMITCGYITLKLGTMESTDIIIKTLEVNEAKGRRKFLGTTCNINESTFNLIKDDNKYHGNIISISSVGMSVMLKGDQKFRSRDSLNDIQLKLKGVLINVSAIIVGVQKSKDNRLVYLILFNRDIPSTSRAKIRLFISKTLQQKLESELDYKLLKWHS